MRMLENEGFAWENYVDIFDGGPTMTARTDQIRSVREARDAIVGEISDRLGDHKEGEKMLVSSGRLDSFAATYGWVQEDGDTVILDPESAKALKLSAGETVTFVPRW